MGRDEQITHWREISGRIRILILGSYERRHKLRLTSLRKSMLEAGFMETRLVEDFPDDHLHSEDLDVHFTKKSEHYMLEWADEILFILFADSDNQGVLSEFRFCSILGKAVMENSLVIVEEGLRLSSQIRGPIKITKINTATFRGDAHMRNTALGHTIKTIEIIFQKLMERD